MYNGIRPVSNYNMVLFAFFLTPITYLRKSKCIFSISEPKPHSHSLERDSNEQ